MFRVFINKKKEIRNRPSFTSVTDRKKDEPDENTTKRRLSPLKHRGKD